MTRYQIIYWRDIPVQVKVREGGARLSCPLSSRFQKTVYRAAYRARAITGFEYINEWRPSDWVESDQVADDVLTMVTAELESDYSDERLDRLARNKGFEDHDD
jgi:hypothetical protein